VEVNIDLSLCMRLRKCGLALCKKMGKNLNYIKWTYCWNEKICLIPLLEMWMRIYWKEKEKYDDVISIYYKTNGYGRSCLEIIEKIIALNVFTKIYKNFIF